MLRDGPRLHGVVVVEWDEDLGRAWIHGPWVDGDARPPAAAQLVAYRSWML